MPSYATEVAADSPVAWYRMQEASGLIQDSSGYGNHASSVTGTPVYQQASPITGESADRAINFGLGPGFSIPDSASLDVGDVFTLEIWLKRNNTTSIGHRYLMSKGTNAWAVGMETSDSYPTLERVPGSWIGSTYNRLNDTLWHHLVFTKNGAAIAIYIDAVSTMYAWGNQTLVNTSLPLEIGMQAGGTFCDAILDEVAVYPTALSAARVTAHYNARSVAPGIPPVTPPVASFAFSTLVPITLHRASIAVRSFDLSTLAPTKLLRRAAPPVGSLPFQGLAPTVRERTSPSIGQAVFTGISANAGRRATPPVQTITFSGLAPVTYRRHTPPVGVISLQGLAPFVPEPAIPQVVNVRSPLVWVG